MDPPTPGPAPRASPIVAFIIGLAIILLASILNAAGLNLTKLDHVRTSAIPKSSRKKDWMRPLWLLGMLLYILSQLIGSTLALEYMRAEYVAPLGSTSLVFNFLFARFLVGTPVTSTDIYGTIVVIVGVIGIVAFGSINSGLAAGTDVAHLTFLWRRPGWLGFFFTMAFALIALLIFTGRLDAILAARADLTAVPFSGVGGGAAVLNSSSNSSGVELDSEMPREREREGQRRGSRAMRVLRSIAEVLRAARRAWRVLMVLITRWLEAWTGPQVDKQVAWTLGIGWACCGGGLAGGCLVFAKATVKLLSGSLSKQNPGNQFGHAAPIFTIALLAATAVLQIICLNRGLKVYDSTLVVPVFYGVYTATGFLDSLIFNDEVDAYQSWTLFLIFASILVLISGVVLLTHKKPEPAGGAKSSPSAATAAPRGVGGKKGKGRKKHKGGDQGENGHEGGEEEALWAVGDASDDDEETGADGDEDEDVDHHQHPIHMYKHNIVPGGDGADEYRGKGKGKSGDKKHRRIETEGEEEGVGLIGPEHDDDDEEGEHGNPGVMGRYHHRPPTVGAVNSKTSSSSGSNLDMREPFRDEVGDEFGDWAEAGGPKR